MLYAAVLQNVPLIIVTTLEHQRFESFVYFKVKMICFHFEFKCIRISNRLKKQKSSTNFKRRTHFFV